MQTFAIIPAAGRSERMGRPKLLLPWQGTTLLEHVLGVWRASRVDRVVIVTHPLDEQLAALARSAGAVVVRPAVAPPEMKTSVRLGLEHVARAFAPTDGDAWLLAPADLPTLTTDVIDRLIDAYQASVQAGEPPGIWAPASAGRRGHPVMFPWPLAAEVAQLAADEGLNALVARNSVRTIEADRSTILEDLDTPEDYERLRRDAR